jgi:hypothetical protein
VTLSSRWKSSPFWIILLLVSGRPSSAAVSPAFGISTPARLSRQQERRCSRVYERSPAILGPVDRTSVEHPTCQEKRTPTMPVGAYPLPPHGPHADGLERPLISVDEIQLSVEAIAILIATLSTRYGVLGAKMTARARENDSSARFMPSLSRQRLRRQK